MANYFWVTLTTREVECSKLTEQEFIEFILEDIKVASDEYSSLTNGGDISFFDLDVEPYRNGISYSCILDTNADEEKARSCFKEIKDKKYFQLAKGWEFCYETSEGDNYKSCFRPEIKLIFDPEVEQQYKNDEKKLADDIARFYADCRYCGD
jgi:hypothetical protein